MAQTVNLNNSEPLFFTQFSGKRTSQQQNRAMKFLLEFVSCCGTTCPATSTSEPAPPSEETRSLVRAPSQIIRRSRKHGSSVNSSDWRPSLSSISEDNVAARVVDQAAGIERAVKRKSGQDRTRVKVRSHGEDYGRASFEIPAFSPTPFMF